MRWRVEFSFQDPLVEVVLPIPLKEGRDSWAGGYGLSVETVP
jgi:hypothetical protein